MTKQIIIDANILIRFLTQDHPTLSPRAREIFSKAEKGEILLYFDEIVMAETVFLDCIIGYF